MKILFIGENGNISWYCVQKALEMGHDVWGINRGVTVLTRKAVQPEVKQIHCDIRHLEDVRSALPDIKFDCICDFICMNGEQAEERIKLFEGRMRQYVLISSAAVYKRQASSLPFTETAEQYELSEVRGYIAGKIAAERAFIRAFEEKSFPVVIVRPHMIFSTLLLTPVGRNDFTQAKMILDGKPLLMLGDGNNLVAPMHSEDFANAFVPLLGNPSATGEAFHIANTNLLTWNECMEQFLAALPTDNKRICHIPGADIEKWDIFEDKDLLRQQMWHDIFDCSKIKTMVPGWKPLIPYREGIVRTVRWLMENPQYQRFNAAYADKMELLYEAYWK